MGGAQPPRTSVISPAAGPVWAARPTAPFLPTAALPRPWWLLQTRQATAWRAPASAREVGVWREAPRCPGWNFHRWQTICSDSSPCSLFPVMTVWECLLVYTAPSSCMAPGAHGWTAALSSLPCSTSDFATLHSNLHKTVGSSGDFTQTPPLEASFTLPLISFVCVSILCASVNHLSCGSLAGKGLSHRPRPSSPFSTDGSTVGTHSLGHQRATRPARKPRSQGTAPHRRDPGADGESLTAAAFLIVHAAFHWNICCCFVRRKLHL